MRKLLRPRDYLLLTFGLLGDVFEEIKDPLKLQEQGSLLLYGGVPERWKRHNFERTVRRMLKTGDIERVIKSNQPVIRLTSGGRENWIREFPLFELSRKPWDGLWRILSFDIPEKLKGRRDSLREKIERVGMGRLQESLYITPYDFGKDLQEFAEVHGLSDFVEVFEARHTFGSEPKELAWRVWQLEKLKKRYDELLQKIENREKLDSKERISLKTEFEEVLLDDPLLPKELLADNWVGYKVCRLFLGR